MDAFISPDFPHVQTVVVRPAASQDFSTRKFPVACVGGIDANSTPVNCSLEVHTAVAAAGAAGGGTVTLGVGRWYVKGPILLPNGVLLKGAGMSLSAIFFEQDDAKSAPPSLLAPATNSTTATRFGIEDLAFYVLSYYVNVINIAPQTDGVRIRRVRIRANAFHCQDFETGIGDRNVPWAFAGAGHNPLIWIHGLNFEIADCDLWSTWSVFHACSPKGMYLCGTNRGGGGNQTARFGTVVRNTVWNGGSCHWLDNVGQIVFESNSCTGNNPVSAVHSILVLVLLHCMACHSNTAPHADVDGQQCG